MATSNLYHDNNNVGIGVTTPNQKLDISGGGIGFSGAGLNSTDKKLYSPADGDLEWMTHNSAGNHGFAVSHQGAKAVYLNTSGNSYLNGGNVGIGISIPTEKLHVVGNIRMVDGNQAAGKVLTSDANGVASWQMLVPSGAVMFFNLTTCPTGWSDLASAEGRYIVGLPSGGTLAGTAGTALTNLESRATGQHSHAVDPPNTSTTTAGSHTHTLRHSGENDENQGYPAGGFNAVWSTDRTGGAPSSGAVNANGDHSHSVDIGSFSSGTSGSVAGTNAPYIQLKVCQKN